MSIFHNACWTQVLNITDSGMTQDLIQALTLFSVHGLACLLFSPIAPEDLLGDTKVIFRTDGSSRHGGRRIGGCKMTGMVGLRGGGRIKVFFPLEMSQDLSQNDLKLVRKSTRDGMCDDSRLNSRLSSSHEVADLRLDSIQLMKCDSGTSLKEAKAYFVLSTKVQGWEHMILTHGCKAPVYLWYCKGSSVSPFPQFFSGPN